MSGFPAPNLSVPFIFLWLAGPEQVDSELMDSDQSRAPNASSDGQVKVRQLLDGARNLALFGAEPMGRELCASIFLNHLPMLLADAEAKQRFIACLLLLEMDQLLRRTLRAFDGVDLSFTIVFADGAERKILSFSNGVSLAILLPEPGADRATRDRFAESWSHRIVEAASCAEDAWIADSPSPVPERSAAAAALAPQRAPASVA